MGTLESKAKQQMSRLVSYCQTLDFQREHKSYTTNSVYFKIAEYRLRISDHFGMPNNKQVTIIVSTENYRQFIVSYINNVFVLNSLKEVKLFILNWYRTITFTSSQLKQKCDEATSKNAILAKKNMELQNQIKHFNVEVPANDDGLKMQIINSNLTNKQKSIILGWLKNK